MPRITNFAYCHDTIIENNQVEVINLAQVLEAVDGVMNFSIVFTLTDFNLRQDHIGYLEFLNPKEEVIFETERFYLEKEEGISGNERVASGATLGMSFNNVLYEGPGVYSMDIIVDDERIARFSIPVIVTKVGEKYD
ncbi:hypothetical protein M3936_16295 [Sutcliffiella horikoshii]|nr:hypothetical protein [Sutcliffiella horikoshii]